VIDYPVSVVTLADWYHPSALAATSTLFLYISSVKPTVLLDAWFAGGAEPVPDSGLVNGVGRYNGGPEVPWPRINVKSGKRYRFRLIGLSAAGRFNCSKSSCISVINGYPGAFEFSISNHSMTVIEADGASLLMVYY